MLLNANKGVPCGRLLCKQYRVMLKLCTMPLLESPCECVSQDMLLTWTHALPADMSFGRTGWLVWQCPAL